MEYLAYNKGLSERSWQHSLSDLEMIALAAKYPNFYLVEEKTVFGILNHPFQSLIQIRTSHCTAWENGPFVRFD